MKHLSSFAAIFGVVAMLYVAYVLLDYALKEITFAGLCLGAAALALHLKQDAA